MSPEELDRILGATTWEQFEATTYGIIDIHHKGWVNCAISFRMCTGLYFGKPVQAIVALGNFVRMRSFDCVIDDWYLKELDPKEPGLFTAQRKHIWNASRVSWTGGLTVSNNVLYGVMVTGP